MVSMIVAYEPDPSKDRHAVHLPTGGDGFWVSTVFAGESVVTGPGSAMFILGRGEVPRTVMLGQVFDVIECHESARVLASYLTAAKEVHES